MKKFKDIRIGTKLTITISLVVCLLMVVFGLYTIRAQKNSILADSDTRMFEQVNDLVNIIDLQINENQQKVDIYGELAYEELLDNGKLSLINSNLTTVTVTNQENNITQSIQLPSLAYNNRPLYENFEFVNMIGNLTKGTNTIFQKFGEGYLRISTNIIDASGKRAVKTFIPNSSPVVQSLNRGETYKGRAIILNEWYLTFYKPLLVNNVVVGAYYFGIAEKNLSELKAIFSSKKIFYQWLSLCG